MSDSHGDQGEAARAPAGSLPERVATLAGEVTEVEQARERHRLTASLAAAVRSAAGAGSRNVRSAARAGSRSVRSAGQRAGAGANWLAAQALAMAPRLPVRDQNTLRTQFPGLSVDELGDALIEGAARASAAVGGAIGAWSLLPAMPAFPVEIATETLALVGIEIKLVAELHEIYGMRAPGRAVDRMTAYVAAWAHRRGVAMAPGGLVLVAGSPLRRRLQRRLTGRAGKGAVSLGPLLTGAAAGALINRRETRKLGEEVRADLRHRTSVTGYDLH